jgi:hypothetical protein
MRDDTSRELAVLALQALLKGDPRFDSEEDEAFGEVDLEGEEAAAPGDESAHASDSSGSEDGESEDSEPEQE